MLIVQMTTKITVFKNIHVSLHILYGLWSFPEALQNNHNDPCRKGEIHRIPWPVNYFYIDTFIDGCENWYLICRLKEAKRLENDQLTWKHYTSERYGCLTAKDVKRKHVLIVCLVTNCLIYKIWNELWIIIFC